MNTLAPIAEARAVPFSETTFRAFKVSEGVGRTYEIGEVEGSTVAEAVNATLAGKIALFHKDHLIIRETSRRGIRLHVFAIKKKSAPRWVMKDHVQRAVYDLYAAPVCSFDAGVVG